MLLDSHVLIWVLSKSDSVGPDARKMILSATRVHFSAASVWELRIKETLGKLSLPREWMRGLRQTGLEELPVSAEHADAIASIALPHRDPFDRLLLAQTAVEGLRFMTADGVLLGLGRSDVVDATR